MSPKALEDIFSAIQGSNDIEFIFNIIIENQGEVLSHPKKKVILTLQEFIDKLLVYNIREHLFIEFRDHFNTECLSDSNIKINQDDPLKSLRKRYKSDKCYSDIYILLLSLYENQIDSKINEVIFVEKNAQVTQPIINSLEATLIEQMTEILSLNKAILKENRELKNRMSSLQSKLETQNSTVTKLNSQLEEQKIFQHQNQNQSESYSAAVSKTKQNQAERQRSTILHLAQSVLPKENHASIEDVNFADFTLVDKSNHQKKATSIVN